MRAKPASSLTRQRTPPLRLEPLHQAETAAGSIVLRRRRRRRSREGYLSATGAETAADDEKPEWARVLEATLDAERQRGEVRAWICKDGVDEHADACHVRRLLGELSADDLSRPFGDERTFGDLALARGRLHFLSAYLDAGGVILKEGGPPLAVGPKGRLASPRSVARCRKLANDWRRYEAAARRSLRPGSHATDLATYLATGIVGVREAAVARRRRLLAYIDWVRRRAAGGTLKFAGPAVEGVALKSAEVPVVEGPTHERARLLLGDANQESPRATTPRSRVMQMLRRQRPVHKSCRGFSTPSTRRLLDGVAHRQRRKQPPVAPNVADALARRGLGRLVASTIAPPVAPEVKKPPEDDSDLECGICLSLLTDPVHTPCLHVFCRACVQKALSRVTNRRCPICRAVVPEGSTRPCRGALLERLDRLRGDAAAQKPLHPRLCVRALGAKCASTLEELRRIAEQRRAHGAPLAGGGLSEVFDVQRLALAVAILCHPGCDVRVRERVEGFL